MKLQLQVGKKYRRRDGEVVEITELLNIGDYRWLSDKGHCYMDDGTWSEGVMNNEDLIEEVPDTKDDNMKQFDLAAVDKLTALCSKGRKQVKQLVAEVVESLGGTVKQEVEPNPGQIWVSEFGEAYVVCAFGGGYRTICLDGLISWASEKNIECVVDRLTYAAASAEEYFAKKAKGNCNA